MNVLFLLILIYLNYFFGKTTPNIIAIMINITTTIIAIMMIFFLKKVLEFYF